MQNEAALFGQPLTSKNLVDVINFIYLWFPIENLDIDN